VIVATNKDLAELVRQGVFREDLYYRVNVVRVELPPLRRRKEDIPLIVEQFIARFNRLQGKAIAGVSVEALSLLMAYDWPGNVRELENVIERAFVLCDSGQLGIELLPVELTARVATVPPGAGIRKARELLEAETIRKALDKAGGNRSAAAKELGIHKTTLFRKLKRLRINPPESDGRSRRRQ